MEKGLRYLPLSVVSTEGISKLGKNFCEIFGVWLLHRRKKRVNLMDK